MKYKFFSHVNRNNKENGGGGGKRRKISLYCLRGDGLSALTFFIAR